MHNCYAKKSQWVLTILFVNVALTQGTREGILYAFDEKIIIEVANIKRDLRRDGGGSFPAERGGNIGSILMRSHYKKIPQSITIKTIFLQVE